MIRIINESESGELLARKAAPLAEAEAVVRPIIDDVRKRGDEAVFEYARKFDGFDRDTALVRQNEIDRAVADMPADLRAAIETASVNIRAFAELQAPKPFMREIAPGQCVGQLVRPLDSVCAYIPSGSYPLVSTVLMTVIPAQVAGVGKICLTSPKLAPSILAAAGLLGNLGVYSLGGAHAIAAFAFGTETIPRVDRIVGPGNIYVAAAKKLLAGEVGIDFIAGPTEIVIIAAEGNPSFIAADMLAQAEHDTNSSAILLTTSRAFAEQVVRQIERQLDSEIARAALEQNSAIILFDSLAAGLEWSNKFAPEHLSVPDESLLKGVHNAGSIFIGAMSPEAAGDYASGPNHVLPTSGAARLRGGLSVADFVKVISTQQLTKGALKNLAPAITRLARAEGLEAHGRSVEVRLNA